MLQLAMASTRIDDFLSTDFDDVVSVETWKGREDGSPIGGTRNANTRVVLSVSFRRRLLIAGLGGIFLVAPMWLMVLHQTTYTSLIATTVCVGLFGVV